MSMDNYSFPTSTLAPSQFIIFYLICNYDSWLFSQLDFHPNFSFTIHLHICFTFHAFNVDIYDKDDDNDDDDDDDDDVNDDDDLTFPAATCFPPSPSRSHILDIGPHILKLISITVLYRYQWVVLVIFGF